MNKFLTVIALLTLLGCIAAKIPPAMGKVTWYDLNKEYLLIDYNKNYH